MRRFQDEQFSRAVEACSDPAAVVNSVATGIHLLAEWYGCHGDAAVMTTSSALRDICLSATSAAGLRSVGELFHQFEPQGVTGTVLLAESHLAIHTWPESGFVTLDVYVCNLQTDNTGKAFKLYGDLKTHFGPQREVFSQHQRGSRID